MATIQCKMCGGGVELVEGRTSGECPYCGSLTTYPRLVSDQVEQLFQRAEHFRQIKDFDKAVAAYEKLVIEAPEEPESYWGLVISRFGIEYVEDPVSHKRLPTCHRVQLDSILADSDYRNALNYAADDTRCIYEQEAQRIAEIQKAFLAISAQEKPYDVFICYKEAAEDGSRTKDSALAQEIYYELIEEGFKVFFSRITLEDKLGQQYEPYIFAALNSAKVMLVIGSRTEYFKAVWVKNEWSRFLALMKKDRNKSLIPCYVNMDAYDIPEELSLFQSQDMSKIGFIQDLLRGIRKLLNSGRNKAEYLQPAEPVVIQQPSSVRVDKLLKRIAIFVQREEWASASDYCERALDEDPENADIYFYECLIAHRLHNKEELLESDIELKADKNFQTAMNLAPQKYGGCSDEQKEKKLGSIYAEAQKCRASKNFLCAIEQFKLCGDFRDAKKNLLECRYEYAMYLLERQAHYLAMQYFAKCGDYRDAKEKCQECIKIDKKNTRKFVILFVVMVFVTLFIMVLIFIVCGIISSCRS